ncbi:RNA-directed DNA polymerase, eukaryota [Tanacetum coccineum]|uniref:RNA-directed DNA polymerase, eukaryota n=1 Tax=Tanacetum coccineum TaxID=301880 RepID=A0ABQ4WBT9_9ASTR
MGAHQWQSKKDQTLKISKSIYVTNFPATYYARDLWKVCNDYGTVVDVFILFKKSKAEGSLPPVKEVVNSEPVLALDDTFIKEHDFSLSHMGKVKTVSAISNLPIILSNEGFHNIKITYLGGMWVLFAMDSLKSKDKLLNHTGVNSWFLTIKEAYNSFVGDERITWVLIEGLPIKAWMLNSFCKIALLWGEIVEWEDSDSFALSNKPLCLKTKIDVSINERRKIIIQGKVYWIRVKELYAWTPSFIEDKHDTSSSADESEDIIGENFVGNKDKIDSSDIDRVLESSFSHANDLVHDTSNNNVTGDAEPHSKDPFNIYGILNQQHNKAINSSTVQSLSSKLKERNLNGGVSSHHSKNSCSSKNKAGGSILEVMDEIVKVGQTMGYNMEGCEIVIMGDFNEVLYEHQRFGTTFNSQGANAFNNFISLAGLIDLPLEDGLLLSFSHLSAICLDRHLSDHCPILLKENSFDFGPTPFRIFHSWFSMKGFDSFVETT